MWCLLGAENTDCQFYGCRTEKVICSQSNQKQDGFFASVAKIPCCLASCSGWVGSTAYWCMVFWLLGEASALSFDSVIQTQTKLVDRVIQEKQMENMNRFLLYKGAGIHVLVCQCQAISLISYYFKKKPHKPCLWSFTCLFMSLPWLALQMTLDN